MGHLAPHRRNSHIRLSDSLERHGRGLTRYGIDLHTGTLFGIVNQLALAALALALIFLILWGTGCGGLGGATARPVARRVLGRARTPTGSRSGRCWGLTGFGGRAVVLPVVLPAGDRVSHRAEEPQNRADDGENDPDGPQDGNAGHKSDDEQNDSENDHGVLRSRMSVASTLILDCRIGKF